MGPKLNTGVFKLLLSPSACAVKDSYSASGCGGKIGVPKGGLDLAEGARSGGKRMETEGWWELFKVWWQLFYRGPWRDGISQPVWETCSAHLPLCGYISVRIR